MTSPPKDTKGRLAKMKDLVRLVDEVEIVHFHRLTCSSCGATQEEHKERIVNALAQKSYEDGWRRELDGLYCPNCLSDKE